MAKKTLEKTPSIDPNEKDNKSEPIDEVNMANSPTKSISTEDLEAPTSKKSKNKKVKQQKISSAHDNVKDEDLYIQPFLKGWKREIVHRNILTNSNQQSDVYYKTPDGKKMRSIPMIAQYLKNNPSELTLENFTYGRKRVYKEPEEIERNALKINKGINSTSKKKKSSPKQISVKSLINVSSPKNEGNIKKSKREKKMKLEKSEVEELLKDKEKLVVEKLKKTKTEISMKEKNVKTEKLIIKPIQKKDSLEKRKTKPRKTKKNVEEKEKMEMKSIDDDIEQLQALCSEHDFNMDAVPSPKKTKEKIKNVSKDIKKAQKNIKNNHKNLINTSDDIKDTPKNIKSTPISFKDTPKDKKNTPKEHKTDLPTSKISRADYMSKVDQLAASNMSYEEKVAAIRNLAKNSLIATQKPDKHIKQNNTLQNDTEEMGKVFEETEDFSDSECSLFSHEEGNESEKVLTPAPVKKKRKATNDGDKSDKKNKKQKKEDTSTVNKPELKPVKRRSLGMVSLSKKSKKLEEKVSKNETSFDKVMDGLVDIDENNVSDVDNDTKIEKQSIENKSSDKVDEESNKSLLSTEQKSLANDQECNDKMEAATNSLESSESNIEKNDKSSIKQAEKKSDAKFDHQNEHQLLVISAALRLQMDLSKSFILKVNDKSIEVTPQQVFFSRNKVTLKLPPNSLPSDYNKNQKLPLIFSVDKLDDHEILNVSFRKV